MVACDICGKIYNIESMHSVGSEWFCEDCYADYVDYLNELQEEEEAASREAFESTMIAWGEEE